MFIPIKKKHIDNGTYIIIEHVMLLILMILACDYISAHENIL
jgi:hypothetical protein